MMPIVFSAQTFGEVNLAAFAEVRSGFVMLSMAWHAQSDPVSHVAFVLSREVRPIVLRWLQIRSFAILAIAWTSEFPFYPIMERNISDIVAFPVVVIFS